jgi:hypothetical protein
MYKLQTLLIASAYLLQYRDGAALESGEQRELEAV